MASEQPGPYGIGSDTWPGLSQLAADAAQVVRRVGAIVGTGAPADAAGLRACLQDELGDLRAAIDYVVGKNALDWDAVNRRRDRKRSLFDRAASEHRLAPHARDDAADGRQGPHNVRHSARHPLG